MYKCIIFLTEVNFDKYALTAFCTAKKFNDIEIDQKTDPDPQPCPTHTSVS